MEIVSAAATTRFRKTGLSRYSVECDCFGEMKSVGTVERTDRPFNENDRWWAYLPNGKCAGTGRTRSDAVDRLVRS